VAIAAVESGVAGNKIEDWAQYENFLAEYTIGHLNNIAAILKKP